MGTDCAPLLANLFLYYHEDVYIKSLEEERLDDIAKKMRCCSRYIDDLLSLNDNNKLSELLNEIYPDMISWL